MADSFNWLRDLAKDDRELYLKWASNRWLVLRCRTDGHVPVQKVLITYGRKFDAIEDLRASGFRSNHSETEHGEIWTRDPVKEAAGG